MYFFISPYSLIHYLPIHYSLTLYSSISMSNEKNNLQKPPKIAIIATAMARGAASLLMVQGSHPESEIDKVTTLMGCTIVGLNEIEYQGLSSVVIQGLKRSFYKISSIGDS